jgi:hypothetical protein
VVDRAIVGLRCRHEIDPNLAIAKLELTGEVEQIQPRAK